MLIGHEPWCLENKPKYGEKDSPLGSTLKPLEPIKFPETKPLFEDHPKPFKHDFNLKDNLLKNRIEPNELPKSSKFDRTPDLTFEPMEPPDRRGLLPKYNPSDHNPMTRKSPFSSTPTGIVRDFEHADMGIRFAQNGRVTDHYGGTIGKLEGNRILDLEGTQIGELSEDRRILSSHPFLMNTQLAWK